MTTPRNTLSIPDTHTRDLFTQLARIAARHFDAENAYWSDLLLDVVCLQAAAQADPEGGHAFIGFREMGTVYLAGPDDAAYRADMKDHTFYRVDWVALIGDRTVRWLIEEVAD